MKILFLIFVLISSYSKSEILLTGTVLDNRNGSPISLVNVHDTASGYGETTDENGRFSFLLNNQEKAELTFSHVAYETHHQVFDASETDIIVKMNETLIQLDNIVVTSTRSGYLLRDVPVATEVIGKKEISESGAITVNDLLQQRAGVSTSANVDGGAIFNMLGFRF